MIKCIILGIARKAFYMMLALLFMHFSASCTHKPAELDLTHVAISENVRENHAKELLKTNYDPAKFEDFKGDKKFSLYVKTYLKKVNPKLGTENFLKAVFRESKQYAYDPIFLMAVIKTESDFNTKAIGSAGEIGLMQIKPSTAKWICEKFGLKWKGPQALTNPEYNVKVSALYFKYLKRNLKSKATGYINAYNMGIGRFGRTPAEEVDSHPYYHKVVKNYALIYDELGKIKVEIAQNEMKPQQERQVASLK